MKHLALTVLTIAACGKSEPTASTGSATPTGSAGSGSATRPVAVVVDAAPVTPDAALLGDLPPLSTTEVDQTAITRSVKLNNEGYKAHVKKDWKTATDTYREAVKADPGNLLARYNLACVYSSSGDDAKAFAVLEQFKQPDCRACGGILLHATKDPEWKSRVGDPRFTAIVDGVAADKVDLKKVTKQLIAALRTGKLDGLEPYVHPRGPIKVTTMAYSPDPEPPDLVYGWSGFVKLVGNGNKSIEDNGVRECDSRCCHTGERGDSSYVIDKVCFGGFGGVVFISEVEIDPGSI